MSVDKNSSERRYDKLSLCREAGCDGFTDVRIQMSTADIDGGCALTFWVQLTTPDHNGKQYWIGEGYCFYADPLDPLLAPPSYLQKPGVIFSGKSLPTELGLICDRIRATAILNDMIIPLA